MNSLFCFEHESATQTQSFQFHNQLFFCNLPKIYPKGPKIMVGSISICMVKKMNWIFPFF